jgi:hypothetical protein
MESYQVTLSDKRDHNFHECVPMGMQYEVWRNSSGLLDRQDGPAVIARDPTTSRVTFEGWYSNGVLHRDGGPAVIVNEWEDSFQLEWHQHGRLHREGAPSFIIQETLATGIVNSIERWHQHGNLHRVGGPASISLSPSGIIEREVWAINGYYHRLDGPSELERDGETGVVTEENWMEGEIYQRSNGPAFVRRDKHTGHVIEQVYFRDGQRIPHGNAPSPTLD